MGQEKWGERFFSWFRSPAMGGPGGLKATQTLSAPSPIGPYSQAVECGDWVYTSGQIGMDPYNQELVSGGIRAETQQILDNLNAILRQAGTNLHRTISVTLYLTDLEDFEAVNEVYGYYFREPFPSRTTVQVVALPKGARIEMAIVAKK